MSESWYCSTLGSGILQYQGQPVQYYMWDTQVSIVADLMAYTQ